MDDFTVTGADELIDVGKRLRRVGDKGRDGVMATMRREINAETKPMRRQARDRIVGALPRSGGLNKWVGRLPTASVRVERDRASVKVVLNRRGHDLQAMNRRGLVRHPLYGNRAHWYSTPVPRGFYEDAVAPEAREMVARVADAIGRAVERTVAKES